MRIRVNRESFLQACQLVGTLASTRDVKPILRNLKVSCDEAGCTLSSTDLEIGLRLTVASVQVEEPGDGLLPAAKLVAILRECQCEDVSVEASVSHAMVKTDQAEFEMPADDAAGYPDVAAQDLGEPSRTVRAETLAELVRRTTFAAGTASNARFGATTGIQVTAADDAIRFVATDGRRLALADGPAVGDATWTDQTSVPTKALLLVARLLGEPDEQVRCHFRPNDATFQTDRATVTTRLIEGRFPDWQKVLPKGKASAAKVKAGAFMQAIRQAAVMTDTETRRVNFAFAANKLTLAAQGSQTGRSSIQAALDCQDGFVATEISFDPQYLVDFLKVLDGDTEVEIALRGGESPAVFRVGGDYRYIVVPLVAKTA